MFNNTSPPSADTALIVTRIDSLLRLEGSAASGPVANLTISGLTVSHTAPTFMKPFASASGGDWSVRVDAALFLNGTRNTLVDGCSFYGVGGNAILLYGPNRATRIEGSSFRFVGDSAIVSLGIVDSIDGTDQQVPSLTEVIGNQASELGLYTKQAGFYYTAKSIAATVSRNVFFNIPRAGVNVNDGYVRQTLARLVDPHLRLFRPRVATLLRYAGGHVVDRNLAFNNVRETSDHGPLLVFISVWRPRPWQRCSLPPHLTSLSRLAFSFPWQQLLGSLSVRLESRRAQRPLRRTDQHLAQLLRLELP